MISFGSETTTRQNLISVFVLALSLLGFGFYLTLGISSQQTPTDVRAETSMPSYEKLIFPFKHPTEDRLQLDKPVQLEFRPQDDAQNYINYFQQITGPLVADPNNAQSKLNAEIAIKTSETLQNDGELRSHREITDIQFDLQDGSKRIGNNIISQLHRAIPGSVVHHRVKRNGYITDSQWENVANPQIERALSLFADASHIFQPRFRRDQIIPGDKWKYRIEIPDSFLKQSTELNGSLEVQNQFTGILEQKKKHLAVIRQTFEIDYSGQLKKDEDQTATFEINGGGDGLVYFNTESRELHHQHVELRRRLVIERDDKTKDQTSKLRYLRSLATNHSKITGNKSERKIDANE